VFRGTPLDVAVARIALLVQGCDATAGLIGMALATDLDVEAVLRRLPPVRVMRRVAGAAVEIGAAAIEAGDPIRCDLDSASDPAVLTFGDGPRSCPGPSHARALATGVISAVRATCTRVDEPVEYRPVAALRLPRHVHVIRR
jgi:cytochrome P450